MKVAATFSTLDGSVYQHFGHTETFKIYDIEDGKILHAEIIDNGGFGHHDLATYLKNLGVEVLILGNRGQGAIDALKNAGIKEIPGITGSADDAARSFAAGTLVGNYDAKCSHHGNHQDSDLPKVTL